MRITIDTNTKEIIIHEPVDAAELIEFIENNDLHQEEYKIISPDMQTVPQKPE